VFACYGQIPKIGLENEHLTTLFIFIVFVFKIQAKLPLSDKTKQTLEADNLTIAQILRRLKKCFVRVLDFYTRRKSKLTLTGKSKLFTL